MSDPNTALQTPTPGGHEGAEQPKSFISSAISDAKKLWAATLTSTQSVRDRQYDFLGAIYVYAQLISANPAALQKFRTAHWLWGRCATKRTLKRLERAGAPELMLAEAIGLGEAQRSLRSKYKRVLEAASAAAVPANRESFNDWIRQQGGIVKVLGKDPLVSHPADGPHTHPGRARRLAKLSERKEAMAALRRELLAKTVEGMSPIFMIGNAPPVEAFVAVIYRPGAGSLVPCYWTDATADVDALLGNALPREPSNAASLAIASNDATFPAPHNPAKEAA